MRAVASLFSTFVVIAVVAALISTVSGILKSCEDGRQVAVNDDGSCLFPCCVKTDSPIRPKVTWYRQLSENDTILRLDDGYWIQEHIYFTRLGDVRCRKIKEEGGFHYYKCDFKQISCNVEVFAGTYLYEVMVQHYVAPGTEPDEPVVGQHNLIIKSHLPDPTVNCFMPVPINVRAVHDGNSTVLLTWDATVPDEDSEYQDYCDGSNVFLVQIRGYSSFEGYSKNPFRPRVTIPYRGTQQENATNFTVGITGRLSNRLYFQFDIKNIGKKDIYPVENITISPLFYFGTQVKAYLAYPQQVHTVMRARLGGAIELRCQGEGVPLPLVSLVRFETAIAMSEGDSSLVQSSLVVTNESAGVYQCVASNTYVESHGGAKPIYSYRIFDIQIDKSADPAHPDSPELVCSPMAHDKCEPYIQATAVLTNTTSRSALQSRVTELITVLEHLPNQTECVNLAKAMICLSSFPYCDIHPVKARPICKRTCELFHPSGYCGGVIQQEMFPEIYNMIFSNCDTRDYPGGSYPECVHIPFRNTEPDISWCSREGNGQDYNGSVSVTETGILCQKWTSETPHRHPVYSSQELYHATWACRNPGGRGERPWCYTSENNQRWEYCNVEKCHVCEGYKGHFCSVLPGYSLQNTVSVDRHHTEWNTDGQLSADNWMGRIYHKLIGADVPIVCQNLLREFLCHSTLPLCSTENVPMKMCSAHCKLEKLLQVCPKMILKGLKKEMNGTNKAFLEPLCDHPEERDRCMSTQPIQSSLPGDYELCYNSTDSGLSYVGNASRTRTGAICKPWGPSFPELKKNYCRNPGPVGSSPWCFTNENKSEWDYCDIPTCKVGIPTATNGPLKSESLGSAAIGIVVTFIIMGVLLVSASLFMSFIMCYLRKKKQKDAVPTLGKLSKNWMELGCNYEVNKTYVQVATPLSKIKEAVENFPQYTKDSIKYIRQLGQGNFGVVFYAKAEGLVKDEKETEVAVKTLKEETCKEALDDFVREAKLMFSFNHPNIVKIFGVCVDEMPFYLIFEYMDKGDLNQFLRASASSLQRRLMNPFDGHPRSRTESTLSDEPPSLNTEQLTDICKQIATGMNYLASNNHVHRDLACRNCLVKSCDWAQTGSGLIIKIGDFGMSHNLYSSDYYRVRGQAVLPVRWMSPEAVIYGKFSTDSDVWSFGVVMWEVFSFAIQPYYGTSNEEVTEAIRRHKILAKPTDCPTRMYDIMKMCWTVEPHLRPTFEELCNLLDKCRLSSSSSTNCSDSPDRFDDDCSDLDSDAFLEENSDAA